MLTLSRVNCLAPLTKCYRLKYLDLSHNYERIQLQSIMHSLHKLQDLTTLCLPPNAFLHEFNSRFPTDEGELTFPPNICELQISGKMPKMTTYWLSLAKKWPPSLQSLVFNKCQNLTDLIDQMAISLWQDQGINQIRFLKITNMRKPRIAVPTMVLFHFFPSLRSCSLPAFMTDSILVETERPLLRGDFLEQLELSANSDSLDDETILSPGVLTAFTESCPLLWQIRVHVDIALFEAVWEDFMHAEDSIELSARDRLETLGRTNIDLDDVGVQIYND